MSNRTIEKLTIIMQVIVIGIYISQIIKLFQMDFGAFGIWSKVYILVALSGLLMVGAVLIINVIKFCIKLYKGDRK